MKSIFKLTLKSVWLCLCVAAVISGLIVGGEANLISAYVIAVLTFPFGIIIFITGSYLLAALSGAHTEFSGYVITILMHIFAIVTGYVQWFCFLPWLVRKMKSEKSLVKWGMLALIAVAIAVYRFYKNAFPGIR